MTKRYIQKMIKFFNTTTKVIIWALTIAGIVWVTWAFILASLGQEQIAETLASEVCRTIFGTIGIYIITACVTNIFKYNDGLIFGTSQKEAIYEKEDDNYVK